VAQHHTLRSPCRAAGVEDASEIGFRGLGVGNRLGAGDERLVVVRAVRPRLQRVVRIDQRESSERLGDSFAHLREGRVDEQQLRPAVR
jgi:hypothetical protein